MKTLLIALSFVLLTPALAESNSIDNCKPITQEQFNELCDVMKGRASEETKLKQAKKTLKKNCASSEQIGTLLSYLSQESTRLELAKYSWAYCSDQDVFREIVHQHLKAEGSIQALEDHITATK